jgi:hypothetical protein
MITDDEVLDIETQRWLALTQAAMDTHPDWSSTPDHGGGWICKARGLSNQQVLIDWFKRSFPMEAKALEHAVTEPRAAASVEPWLQSLRQQRKERTR